VKWGLIGLLGLVLFIAGCALFVMVSQTATQAWLLVGQVPGRGTEYRIASPYDRTYPLAQQMGRLWPPEALVFVNLYLAVLAVCVGTTLTLITIHALGTRDDTKQSRLARAGWIALCTSLVIGVVVANASTSTITGPFRPWDPVRYIFALLSPQTSLDLLSDLLSMSVLLSLAGFFLAWRLSAS
jgi:hypothetical protein